MYSRLKSTMLVLALIALVTGVAACAKYPVLASAPEQSPSAMPAPTR